MEIAARFPADLVRRVVGHLAAATLDAVDDCTTIDPSIFVDPELFATEREVLFRRSPHIVGWAGEVRSPGSFTTRDVAGVPVVITRSDDGQLRAFLNACTHRGAQVAHGCGEARRLTCPYHAWTFDLHGQLAGQSDAWAFEGIDPATLGLMPLPVSEQCGLLVVGLEPDVVVDGFLDPIAPHLTGYGYATHELVAERRYQVAANWKLAFDINLEVYHVAYLHRETLHPMIVNHTVHEQHGRFGRHAFPMRSVAEWADRPEAEWPEPPMISVVHTLFPSCVVLETPVSSQMFRIYPGRVVGSCTVDVVEANLVPVGSDDERAHRMHGFELACHILEKEDFPAAEQCQRGASGGARQFVFGRHEPMLQHWHRQWAQACMTPSLLAATTNGR